MILRLSRLQTKLSTEYESQFILTNQVSIRTLDVTELKTKEYTKHGVGWLSLKA